MNSRRDVLITLAGVAGATTGTAQQPQQHPHSDPPNSQAGTKPHVDNKVPKKPTFFTAEEYAKVDVLTDLIIPRTDTPGAKDAGVAFLIDERMPRDPKVRSLWREGLASLDRTAKHRFKSDFLSLPVGSQTEMLTAVSRENDTPARRFFEAVKGATVDAYYDTREGLMEELGWHGNVALREFPGCTHPEHQG